MKKNNQYLLKLSAVIVAIFIISVVACKKDAKQNSTPVTDASFQPYSLGCELLPASEYAKIPQAKAPEIAIKASVLNLNVPPVGNQGSEGCCVAFGTTYDARSINWQATHPGTWSNSVNIFSPEFVYNQIKLSSDMQFRFLCGKWFEFT